MASASLDKIVIAASRRGAVTASSLSRPMIRSTPSEPPTAGVAGPPSDSLRVSEGPPPPAHAGRAHPESGPRLAARPAPRGRGDREPRLARHRARGLDHPVHLGQAGPA